MPDVRIFNPATMNAPRSPYRQVAEARASKLVFIAGQVAVDRDGKLVGINEFEAQCAQVFKNIETALASVGAGWNCITQFTSYVVRADDLARFTKWRTREFPRLFPDGSYPPNTLLVVSRLAHEDYLLEVQATAVL